VRGPVHGEGGAGLSAVPRRARSGPGGQRSRGQGPGSAGAVRRAAAEVCGEETGHQDVRTRV